jgi:hypothetical protein
MDKTNISFTVDSTNGTIPLSFEAWVDDVCYFTTDHVTGPTDISFAISDDDAEHVLRLIMRGKTEEHTTVDEENVITADVVLTINHITFDEITLGHTFIENAVYRHNFNDTQDSIDDEFYGNMGCNGEVSLKFTSPIYLWLLEKM